MLIKPCCFRYEYKQKLFKEKIIYLQVFIHYVREVNVDLTVNKKGECSQITRVENLKSFHIERPSQTCSVKLVEDLLDLNIRF